MKKRITKNTRERQITRRELVGGALAAAGGVITGAPVCGFWPCCSAL